jgi:ATP-dependent RNA helicase DDX46/PRP5
MSGAAVPEELKQIWDEFVKEMEAQGKKVKACSGGFEGKGFKFNEQEEAVSDERKKIQKLAFDLHVDSDEEDADLDLDEQIEDLFKSKRSVKDKQEEDAVAAVTLQQQQHQQQIALTAVAPAAKVDLSNTGIANALSNVQASIANKLKMAKEMADKVAANKSASKKILLLLLLLLLSLLLSLFLLIFIFLDKDNVDQLAKSIMEGTSVLSANLSSKSVAEQIAEKLNMKLNYTKQENTLESDAETFRVFEEELEINDFPQQARWRITSKDTISHICEYAEVGLTVRGTYFPPGSKEPPLGERRLYLAIESLNEKGLTLAKSEISRIIKEEINKLQNPAAQLINKGRYKII